MKIKKGKWYLTKSNDYVKADNIGANGEFTSSISFSLTYLEHSSCKRWTTNFIVRELKKDEITHISEYLI